MALNTTISLLASLESRNAVRDMIWMEFDSIKVENEYSRQQMASRQQSRKGELKAEAPIPWLRWRSARGEEGQTRKKENFEKVWARATHVTKYITCTFLSGLSNGTGTLEETMHEAENPACSITGSHYPLEELKFKYGSTAKLDLRIKIPRPTYTPVLTPILDSASFPEEVDLDLMRGVASGDQHCAHGLFIFNAMTILEAKPHFTHTEQTVIGPDNNPIILSIFTPKEPVAARPALYHIHGDGMVSGDRFTALTPVMDLLEGIDCVFVSVEHRLASETRAPGSAEDNYAGLVTMSGMAMDSSTSSSMPMSSTTMMGMDSMAMTFFFSSATPLFSMNWTPNTKGQYAGTCIFLIAFAAIFRALLAIRFNFYPLLTSFDARRNGGLEYEAHTNEKSPQRAWRAREAVMTGFIDVVLTSVGYLVIIAVMTMNVGYFLSVLAGVFVGSVVFCRFMVNLVSSH
ncbi:hypothetical protein DV736_g6064, partial [Chaetothyriales sp. CBS 134916]